MTLKRAQPLDGRRARLILDRARNPKDVTRHAARRFIDDAHACGYALPADDVWTGANLIRELCSRANKIYRGKNSYILRSGSWFLFYRDDVIVTVMHAQSPRRFH